MLMGRNEKQTDNRGTNQENLPFKSCNIQRLRICPVEASIKFAVDISGGKIHAATAVADVDNG